MKALILAAGFGKRLRPITLSIPKAMVPVNGVPLLVNALNHLSSIGVDEIGIVIGHMGNYIRTEIGQSWKGVPVSYFENERYLETNNIVSLYKAAEFCTGDMLMLECDLFYRQELLECLMGGDGECNILVSPFDKETMDGTIIQTGRDGCMSLVLGKWQMPEYDYSNARKTVNMYKFTGEFVRDKFMPLTKWYVENVGVDSYYEIVLGCLMYMREYDIRLVEVASSMWCEIDDADDLKRAGELFK